MKILIIIGIGLLGTEKLWVPPLVEAILAHETKPVVVPVASTTLPVARPGQVATGVEGVVTIGPVCPVERFPADPACAPRPYQTTLVISSVSRVLSDLVVVTDTSGYFSHELAPGDYTIGAASNNSLPSLSPVTFTVTLNNRASLNLQFDSGIR